jgi:hypothetical protein
MCSGGHLPYGSAITFGKGPFSGCTSAEITGAPNPSAAHESASCATHRKLSGTHTRP